MIAWFWLAKDRRTAEERQKSYRGAANDGQRRVTDEALVVLSEKAKRDTTSRSIQYKSKLADFLIGKTKHKLFSSSNYLSCGYTIRRRNLRKKWDEEVKFYNRITNYRLIFEAKYVWTLYYLLIFNKQKKHYSLNRS